MANNNKPIALIIEDDPDLIRIFARALELSGYQTSTVSDGKEAITMLSGDMVPDIVILDLHLPGVRGSEILHTIRADSRFAHTRVILATADYLLAENLREDADMVLLKPISFSQLRELSSRFISTHDSLQTDAHIP
ncbi:response regulator [Candidatus Leptofilum sp.]|uniref:response regulator n=1 Tax=Candidatus Leptofilum sp. TaxID=3241576 RepID=UPI003B5B7915